MVIIRILICAVMMELTFMLSVISDFLYISALSHIFAAIDNVANVYFVMLMLEHNTDEYKKFVNRVSHCCCCNKICCWLELKTDSDQSGTNIKKDVESVQVPKLHAKSNSITASDNGYDNDLQSGTGIKNKVIDTGSSFGVDQSYYNSEISKDDTPPPDPL